MIPVKQNADGTIDESIGINTIINNTLLNIVELDLPIRSSQWASFVPDF